MGVLGEVVDLPDLGRAESGILRDRIAPQQRMAGVLAILDDRAEKGGGRTLEALTIVVGFPAPRSRIGDVVSRENRKASERMMNLFGRRSTFVGPFC